MQQARLQAPIVHGRGIGMHGSASVFVLAEIALELLEAAAMDGPGTGQPRDAEASMLLRSLKIYSFNVRMGPPACDAQVPYCARCFSQLLLTHAAQ